jgi:putative redox protein
MAEARRSEPAEARWEGGYRANVSVRQFRFVVDEPARFGGEDTGPMPTEYILVAISSCYAMALGHVARKRDIALGPLTVRAVATYDGPSFSSIDLEVEFDDEPPPEIDELVARASKVCYVSNTLTRSPTLRVALKRSRC